MASRGSENGASPPVNDSIDELLEGLPAEPMLPKKRAKLLDRRAPPPSNRRLEDNVVVSESTDPRGRAQRDLESGKLASSTFGTAFLETNATRQRAVVAVVMMIAVLGTYAFLRHRKKEAADETARISAQNQPAAIVAPVVSASAIALDAVPPPPVSPTVDSAVNANAAKTAGPATHKPPKGHAESHGDAHAPTTPASSASANTRTDVARSL